MNGDDRSLRSKARDRTKRATKRFSPGEYRVVVTFDHVAKRRIVELLKAVGMWVSWWEPKRLPSGLVGELVRAMMTDYWDWIVRCEVEPDRPQDVVGKLEAGHGWTDDELAVRKMAEVYVGMAEVMRQVRGPAALHHLAEEAGEVAAGLLREGDLWGGAAVGSVEEGIGRVAEVLMVAGDRICVDVAMEGVKYARGRWRAEDGNVVFHGEIYREAGEGGGSRGVSVDTRPESGGDRRQGDAEHASGSDSQDVDGSAQDG